MYYRFVVCFLIAKFCTPRCKNRQGQMGNIFAQDFSQRARQTNVTDEWVYYRVIL